MEQGEKSAEQGHCPAGKARAIVLRRLLTRFLFCSHDGDAGSGKPASEALVFRALFDSGNSADEIRLTIFHRRNIRIFYAFDPRRSAILLIGGNKAGNKRFYEEMIAAADRLYDIHLAELRREGFIP